MNSIAIELVLFPFAHVFNRFYNTIPFLLSIFVGAFRYDNLMQATGHQELGEISSLKKFRLGMSFMCFYGCTLLLMIISVQIIKVTLKRTRPQRNIKTQRLSNLRAAENGTYSMPSGDSAAAAVFCFYYAVLL